MKNKIGIIGNGYVGSAVAHGFSPAATGNCEVKIYDTDPSRSLNTLEETVSESDFIFISVPTPMQKNGSIDLSIIYDVFVNINKINKRTDNIIILKSTVTPGTTDVIQKTFCDLNIVFNPEFLTEKTSRLDFINQQRVVLGGKDKYIKKVEQLYRDRFKYCHIIKTDYKTAEMIKYFSNIFFMVKLSFANEMYKITSAINADWDVVLEGAVSDGRIADSHLNVPGPDGRLGFSGSCFPKDINAFMSFADKLGINTIKGAWKTNLEVRPDRDWEQLEGRAVSKKKDS